jgi:hypothetical protein
VRQCFQRPTTAPGASHFWETSRIYNEDTSHLRTDPEVVDDLLERMEYEQTKFAKKSPKGYETLEHDVILWHFVKRKRPTAVESPLDARYWIATIDFRFLGLDSFKRRNDDKRSSIPICVHASTLVQMLQFWSPRTDQLDAALLESLRPMLPRRFDPDAEKVTIDILRIFSRFENINDVDEETLASTMMNRALRQRMAASQTLSEKIAIVKETLTEEWKAVRLREGKRMDDLSNELRVKDEKLKALSDALQTVEHERGATEAQLLAQLQEERKSSQELQARLAELERRAQLASEQKLLSKRRIFFGVKYGLLTALALIMGLMATWVVRTRGFISLPTLPVVVETLILLGMVWLIERAGHKDETIAVSATFRFFSRWVGRLMTLLGFVATAFIIPYLYELIRPYLDSFFNQGVKPK